MTLPDPIEVPYRTRAGSWALFEKRYEPVLKDDGSFLHEWDEVRETYNDEPEGYRYIWTIVEEGETLYAMPGTAMVNRLGYLLCKKPWPDMESMCPGYRYA